MGTPSRAVERRLLSLERRPIRLCWTICAAFAFPVLATALIEHHLGHAQSARELSTISGRLEKIEAAVDAIAIEVERISESQRFTSRLQSEQQSPRLPRGNA